MDGKLQHTTPCASVWKANGHTEVGCGKWAGNHVDFAAASIDDVRLYNTALTASDIITIAQAAAAKS